MPRYDYIDQSEILPSPPKAQPDIKGLIRDPEFQALPFADRRQLLSEADPEFAGLSEQDQAQLLSEMKQQDWWQPAKERSSVLRRAVGDTAVTAVKAAIGWPESVVGIADLATAGYAGKALEAVGYKPKEARAILDTLYSPEQQEANRAVSEAEGFMGTVKAAVQNPSTIAHAVIESAPSMIGGAGVARGVMRALPRVGAAVASAIGEGVISAGSAAEQIRQESDTGLLTRRQTALAAGSGVLTGVIGRAGSKLAGKIGLEDIDVLLTKGGRSTAKNIARRVASVPGGMLSEGVFEELPQSAQEQVLQNIATGKPWNEGLDQSMAMGMLSGAAMGGGAQLISGKASVADDHDVLNPDQQPVNTPQAQATPAIGGGLDGSAPNQTETILTALQTGAQPQPAPVAAPEVQPAEAAPMTAIQPDALTPAPVNTPVAPTDPFRALMERRPQEAPTPYPEVRSTIDAAAHAAAPSPTNDLTAPTEGQKQAGNYKKGLVNINGLRISIENPEGSTRSGTDPDGTPWETTMTGAHYGYIKGTSGKDRDHIDVFIRPGIEPQDPTDRVYVVDQIDPQTGKFDEHKIMLGFDSQEEAQNAYLANYDDTGPTRIGGIRETSMAGLKAWLQTGNTKKPFGRLDAAKTAEEPQGSQQGRGDGQAGVVPGVQTEAEAGAEAVPGVQGVDGQAGGRVSVVQPSNEQADPNYTRAVEIARTEGDVNVPRLQAQLGIGYIDASQLMDRLYDDEMIDDDGVFIGDAEPVSPVNTQTTEAADEFDQAWAEAERQIASEEKQARQRANVEALKQQVAKKPKKDVRKQRVDEFKKKYGYDQDGAQPAFVKAHDGSINFGEIKAKLTGSDSTVYPAGPIRLEQGGEYGWSHIAEKRIQEFKDYGYADELVALSDIASSYTEIYEQPNGRLLLVKRNGRGKYASVELQKRGSYYGVTTWFLEDAKPKSKTPYEKRGGRSLLLRVAHADDLGKPSSFPGSGTQGQAGNSRRSNQSNDSPTVPPAEGNVKDNTVAETQRTAHALLPKGWKMEVGRTRTKEGHTFEAEVDWQGKRLVFSEQKHMDNPEIINHEIAHVIIETLPEKRRQPLFDDYIKAANIDEWTVQNQFHHESIAIDYGKYLTDPASVDSDLAKIFDKHLGRQTQRAAKEAATRAAENTLDFMGLQQAYQALERIGKAGAEAMPHLIEVGKAVYRKVGRSLQSWTDGMRTVLGELYPRFRGMLLKVYNDVSRMLKDERGAVGPDINAQQASTAKTGDLASGRPSRVEFDAVLERVTAGLKDTVRKRLFATVDAFAELPAAIREEAERQGDDTESIEGAYHNGKIYLVRDNIASSERLEEAIFHEWHGHFGLKRMFGNDLHHAMLDLYTSLGASKMYSIGRKHGVNLMHYGHALAKAGHDLDTRRAFMTVEMLAHLTKEFSTGNVATRIREIVGMIRAWLRRHGFMKLAEYGETDIAYLLKRARKYAESGVGQTDGKTVFFARATQQTATDDAATLEAEQSNPEFRQRAVKALEWAKSAARYMSPLGHLEGRREYLSGRYRLLGNLDEIDSTVKRIFQTLSRAYETGDSDALHTYFTTKDADVNTIRDAQVRQTAEQVKGQIVAIGDALVERGWLKPEKHEETRGSYLPRVYLKHILGETLFAQWAGGKKLDMGNLKQRKDIPEEVRRIVYGEVKNAAYLAARAVSIPLRDLAISEWLESIAADRENGWVLPQSLVSWAFPDDSTPRKVTPFWLKNEAERLRRQAYHMPDADAAEARDLADRMEDAANEALEQEGMDPQDIKKVPKGYKKLSDSPRYGVLRGMVVRKEIYNDIVGTGDIQLGGSEVWRAIAGAFVRYIGYWKWAKVAANVSGQVRNFVTNMVLLHLSGVPFVRVPQRIVQAILEIRSNGRYWQIAKKGGVRGSTFANVEMGRIEDRLKAHTRKDHKDVSWMDVISVVGSIFSKVYNVTGDIYQFMEAVGKTAKIIDMMEREGADAETAVLEAHEALFDYSLVPSFIRMARISPMGAPFITFAYKAFPIILKTAATKPWRLTPYIILLSVLPMMIAGGDDDELEALKQSLPEWLREKGQVLPLPWKDSAGRWQFVDLSYFMPWTPFTELAGEIGSGEFGKGAQTTSLFGSPVISMIQAVQSGVDPFTRRKIVPEVDATPTQQIRGWLAYLYRLNMPTFLTREGAAGKLYDAITEDKVDRFGDPVVTIPQALARFAGVNIYPVDPAHSRMANVKRFDTTITALRRERTMKLQRLGPGVSRDERLEIVKRYNAKIRDVQQRKVDYGLGSAPK